MTVNDDTAQVLTRPVGHRHSTRLFRWRALTFVVVCAAAVLAVAYVSTALELRRLQGTSGVAADQQAAQLVARIGAHLALPKEKPTIATVDDAKKLVGQSFFKAAHDGDKVLIYAQTQEAILYRPSTDMVIEVAHVSIKH